MRHVVASPLRSALLVVSVALGVASYVGNTAASRSILSAFLALARDVSGKADLVVDSAGAGVDTGLVEAIAKAPSVAHAAAMLEIVTTTVAPPRTMLVLGLDFFGDRHFMPMKIDAGDDVLDDPLAFANDPYALLITRSLAARSGVAAGGKLALMTPAGAKDFHVRGILADEGIAAIFGGDLAVMLSDAAEITFGRIGKADRVLVALKPGATEAQATAEITPLLAGTASIGKPKDRTKNLASMAAPMRQGLGLAGIIALVVGMLLIFSAVSIAVARRKRELGTLRALGASNAMLIAAIVFETLLLAAAGGVLGVWLGRSLAEATLAQTAPSLSRFYAPVAPPPPVVDAALAFAGIALGVLVSLLASWLAARRVVRLDPVEALRRLPAEPPRVRQRVTAAFGVGAGALGIALSLVGTSDAAGIGVFAFIAAGVLLMPTFLAAIGGVSARIFERVLGLPGRLAVDYARRDPTRSATTAAALMIGVSASMCIGAWAVSLERSMMRWVEQALPSDLYVTAGSPVNDERNVPFTLETMTALADLDGVRLVTASRTLAIDLDDARLPVLGMDAEDYYRRSDPSLVRGGPKPIDGAAMHAAPLLVLSENAASRLHLSVGDRVRVHTTSGARELRVYAIAVDYTSDSGIGMMDRRWLRELWGDSLVDTIAIEVKPGSDRAAVADRIRGLLGRNVPLFVVSAAELRAEIKKALGDFLGVFHAIDLLALIIAALGVASAMVTAVADRVRDIAVLRVIGGDRAQIARWTAAEAAYLAIAAALFGAIVGWPMGYVFVRVFGAANTGWIVDYVFPLRDAALVAGGCVALAASIGAIVGYRAATAASFADTLRVE